MAPLRWALTCQDRTSGAVACSVAVGAWTARLHVDKSHRDGVFLLHADAESSSSSGVWLVWPPILRLEMHTFRLLKTRGPEALLGPCLLHSHHSGNDLASCFESLGFTYQTCLSSVFNARVNQYRDGRDSITASWLVVDA